MNKINFTGGFLLPKTSAKSFDRVYNQIPRKRHIQFDLYTKGDMFFATKNCYDGDILKFLKENKIAFKYFPKVNLKNRFDSYYPEETRRILEHQNEVYTQRDDLSKYIKVKKPPKYTWIQGDYIDNTFKTIGVNKENFNIQIHNCIMTVYDKQNNLVANVSPYNNNGENFVISYSRNDSDTQLTLSILNYKGEIVDTKTDISYLKTFRKRFLNAVETERERIKTTK